MRGRRYLNSNAQGPGEAGPGLGECADGGLAAGGICEIAHRVAAQQTRSSRLIYPWAIVLRLAIGRQAEQHKQERREPGRKFRFSSRLRVIRHSEVRVTCHFADLEFVEGGRSGRAMECFPWISRDARAGS